MIEIHENTELKRRQESVYIEYKDKVTGYVRGKISNPHEAEDIVSDVFMKVLKGLSGFDESTGSDTEENLLNMETLDRLADALSRLGERERDIIILHYYGGKTLKDTANQMGVSYSYIKLLHSKALKTLRDIIDI